MNRCIVIGAGRISLSHLPHIINYPNLELVGIIEPNRITRFIIKKLTNIKVYKRLENIDDNSFDTVFILTPPAHHFKISLELIKKISNSARCQKTKNGRTLCSKKSCIERGIPKS